MFWHLLSLMVSFLILHRTIFAVDQKYCYIVNDNCLGELHLLANTFFCWQILYSDNILYKTLCKYIIQSNIEDLWLTIVNNQCTNKKSRQLKVIVIYTFFFFVEKSYLYLLKMYSPIKFIYIYIYMYRQMVDICVCTYVIVYIYE